MNSKGMTLPNGTDSDVVYGPDQIPTNGVADINTMSAAWQSNSYRQAWCLPFSAPKLTASFSSDVNAQNIPHWTVDSTGQGGSDDGVLPATTAEDSSLLSSATNAPQGSSSHSASRNDIGQDCRRLSPIAYTNPLSNLSQGDHGTELSSCFDKGSTATSSLTKEYFAKIHPYWPILHAPTFNPASASDVLVGSVIILAGWLKGEQDSENLAALIFNEVIAISLV